MRLYLALIVLDRIASLAYTKQSSLFEKNIKYDKNGT